MASLKHPLAPSMRLAFLRAIRAIGKESENEQDDYSGKTLSQIMRIEIGKHGLLAVMGAMSKYVEREGSVKVTGTVAHDHRHGAVSDTSAFLAGVLGSGSDNAPTEPGEERPILPH